MSDSTPVVRDSVRLSDQERRALLRSITKRCNSAPEAARRNDTRFALPPGYIVVAELFHAGGGSQKIMVTMRDISRTGLAMLHGGFVYPDTKCRFVFLTDQREPLCEVQAKVVRCVHVKGHVHDIGVRFDTPLPVDALFKVAEREDEKAGPCKYPAMLAVLEDLLNVVRQGAELQLIIDMLGEVQESIKAAGEASPEAAKAQERDTKVA